MARGLIFILYFSRPKKCITVYKYSTSYLVTSTLVGEYEYLLNRYSKEKCKPIIILKNEVVAEFIDLYFSDFNNILLFRKLQHYGT